MTKSVLICEFWGLGDAVLATTAIQRFLKENYKVTLFCSSGSKALLERTYPDIDYFVFELPWKSFHRKYHFWRWNWFKFFHLMRLLFSRKDDAIISVRPDPRDHFLMRLTRCKNRYGVKRGSFGFCLSKSIDQTYHHRVEDWNLLCDLALGVRLDNDELMAPKLLRIHQAEGRKVVFHVGARIEVRRLELGVYRKLIQQAKEKGWEVHVIADPDGYGSELENVADSFYDKLSLEELQKVYEGMSGFVGNDSAPAHIASAMGLPVLAFFGPTAAEWFRPWGDQVSIIQDNVCPFRPCFDKCRFERAICMDCLSYARIRPEYENFLSKLKI
jgi:ADP-heptose:LPS heptosyltransferase